MFAPLSEIMPNLDANGIYTIEVHIDNTQYRSCAAYFDGAIVQPLSLNGTTSGQIRSASDKYFEFVDYTGAAIQAMTVNGKLKLDIRFNKAVKTPYSSDLQIVKIKVIRKYPNTQVALAKRDEAAYTYGFNGMERDDETSGSGNHYTTFYRPYDSRLGRWWGLDPVFHPNMSPYNAYDNNPIVFVDPLGSNAGKYENENGKELGDDGQDNDDVHVVTDRSEQKMIKKNERNDQTTPLDQVSSATTLPSKEVRSEMKKVVGMDSDDPFREYGGVIGEDGKVVWAEPGDRADPTIDKKVGINPYNAANPSEKIPLDQVKGTFHSHPSGEKTITVGGEMDPFGTSTSFGSTTTKTKGFTQTVHKDDITNAANRQANGQVSGNSYVIGTASEKVYIYNGNGVQATYPLSKW